MNNAPFLPEGPLVHIVAAVAPGPTPVQLPTFTGLNPNNQEFGNDGAVTAFLVHASSLAACAALAALGIPAGGASQAGMLWLPSGADKIYSLPSQDFYTAITASGTTDIYAVAGDGN